MNSSLSKLSKRQPIQQLAFHKQQWEINGVQFQCHESYYEGELLNGIDLKIKEVNGLKKSDKIYDYLQESQQIVFCASSNMMLYNTHKRTYHQLFTIQGEVVLLKTHLQNMNNREYIIWIENSSPIKLQTQAKLSKLKSRKPLNKMPKKSVSLNEQVFGFRADKKAKNNLAKSIFRAIPEEENNQTQSSFDKKIDIIQQNNYVLKIYDYTRKQFIFCSPLTIPFDQTVKDVFLFWNHFKIVSYITEQSSTQARTIHYQNIEAKKEKVNQGLFGLSNEPAFSTLQTEKELRCLVFNNELNNFIFFNKNSLNSINVKEDEDDDHQLFNQFLNLTNNKDLQLYQKSKTTRLYIEQQFLFEEQILRIALNDQYLAILTSKKIFFHSAFDITSRIFEYEFDSTTPIEPFYIEFNKSILMLTHRNSATIYSYVIKNKTLKFSCETVLELSLCKEIQKIYINNISSQIFCVVQCYELQNRDYGNNMAKTLLSNILDITIKPTYIDIACAFLTAAKVEANLLGISQKKYKKIHTCAWLSSYVIQTEEGIEFKQWKQNIQNKKCICIHPTGLFLVVCLKQSFKIYIITFEGFVNTYRGDSIKDIQSCSISQEGNHLAISSTNNIYIYDFYSCSKIRTIALAFGINIESIQYSKYNLLCYLKSKKVYIYDSLNQYKEIIAFNPKNYIGEVAKNKNEEENIVSNILEFTVSSVVTMVTFTHIFYDPLLNFFIYSYKNTVYFFNCTTQTVQNIIQFDHLTYIYYNFNLSTLFLGTQNGQIICFAWPNKPTNLQNQQRKFKLHAGKIIDIKVSSDMKSLITISDDESLCICSITFVENLKKFEGIELVEHLSNTAKICYDFLSRKGFYQYTHNKFNDKNDILKDYQDQVLNMNFILPQERQKQKQQMLNTVNSNIKEIAFTNNAIYKTINEETNSARDTVNKLYYEFNQFNRRRTRQIEQLKLNLYADYIKYYNNTESSIKELQQVKVKCQKEISSSKKYFDKELQNYELQFAHKFSQLKNQHQIQVKNSKQDNKLQLHEIDQQRQLFVQRNLTSLNDLINDISNNNGILVCKNNNLQKQIIEMKRKIQEHRYLLYRLQSNTKKIKQEQEKYELLKIENKKNVEKEDKINLTDIEKRYVKHTQILIEKDKEINIQLINHEKQTNIIIHLQKCVEDIERNIEELVENILQQKKDKKQQLERIENIKALFKEMNSEVIAKKKEKISGRNQFNNYICKLENIIEDIVHTRSRARIIELLQEKGLIDASKDTIAPQTKTQENQLNKLMSEKVQNRASQLGKLGSSKLQILKNNKSANNMSYRTLKTEGADLSLTNKIPSFTQRRDFISISSRQFIDKQSKDIYMKLQAEKKQYERIKTEQLVFKNSRKKFNLENQDLIEYYNSLAIQNKKAITSLKRQESLNRLPIKKQKNFEKAEINSTPFMLYLENKKATTNRNQKHSIPSKMFEF